MKKFLLSIIVPVYNEEQNISLFLDAIIPVITQYQYELIFIDDGSTDNTENKIKNTCVGNKNIKLVSFSRNFGQQMAFTAGYNLAKGDCVVSIDVDLQDPPELIKDMINKWQKGYHIVYAKREQRQESFFKKHTALLFYKFINILSDTQIPINIGDYRLIDRRVVDFLNNAPEKIRFLRGLVAWTGFKSTSIAFIRKERTAGITHYPFSKMVKFALDGIISFSTKPLKIASYIGFITSFIAGLGIIYAIYRRLFMPAQYWVTGWTALFVAVIFFGGVQLITIGIIGEYIGKIYTEIQGRPQFIIKEKVNF